MQTKSGFYQGEYRQKLSNIKYMKQKTLCQQYEYNRMQQSQRNQKDDLETSLESEQDSIITPSDKQIIRRISGLYPQSTRTSQPSWNLMNRKRLANDIEMLKKDKTKFIEESKEVDAETTQKERDLFSKQIKQIKTQLEDKGEQKRQIAAKQIQIQKIGEQNSPLADPSNKSAGLRKVQFSAVRKEEKHSQKSPSGIWSIQKKTQNQRPTKSQHFNSKDLQVIITKERIFEPELVKSPSLNLPTLNLPDINDKHIQTLQSLKTENSLSTLLTKQSSRSNLLNVNTQNYIVGLEFQEEDIQDQNEISPITYIQKINQELPLIETNTNLFRQSLQMPQITSVKKKNQAFIQQFKLAQQKKEAKQESTQEDQTNEGEKKQKNKTTPQKSQQKNAGCDPFVQQLEAAESLRRIQK